MSTPLLAAVGHGSTALWYLTRATGLVALVLLSATVVVGIVCSVGWVSERWPRFLSQALHRNLSLLSLGLIVVHVLTTVGDGYVPISVVDAVIPFRSPYRPIWVGLGACAFDLLLAVAITSALRRHLGARLWRAVHWLAYACWPVALFHALGSGSDARLGGAQLVYLVCVAAVVGALGWRIAAARAASPVMRTGAAVTGVVVVVLLATFAFLGPLRPGWSRRAGTSSALLAALSGAAASRGAGGTATGSPSTGQSPTTSTPGTAGLAAPFTSAFSGTYSVVGPDPTGHEQVVFSAHLEPSGSALSISLSGSALDDGVSLSSGTVTLGSLQGPVTSLDGSVVSASVSGSGRTESLSIQLVIDDHSNLVSGSVSAARSAGGKGSSP